MKPMDWDYSGGEELLLAGRKIILLIVTEEGKTKNPMLVGNRIVVYKNPYKDGLLVKNKLREWYRERARLIIHERLQFFKHILGVDFKAFRIKDQKTRWGSCSGKGNLNFNWRLIMAPPEILDYVVVHELCHLKQMNHSREFWQLVASQAPEYRFCRRWLKENGSKLVLP